MSIRAGALFEELEARLLLSANAAGLGAHAGLPLQNLLAAPGVIATQASPSTAATNEEISNQAAAFPTLSTAQPIITVRMQDYVGNGITLTPDNGAGATTPIPLARPADDNLRGQLGGARDFQIGTAYGIDAGGQGFTVTFQSQVAGNVVISLDCAFDTGDNSSRLTFGRYQPAGSTLGARNISAAMNDAVGIYLDPSIAQELPIGPLSSMSGNDLSFNWQTIVAAVDANASPLLLPVVVGTNTLTVTITNPGLLIQGIAIQSTSEANWQNDFPTYTPPPVARNLGGLQTNLALAGSQLVSGVFIGDSLLALNNSWGDWLGYDWQQNYGDGGRWMKLGAPSGSPADLDTQWSQHIGSFTDPLPLSGGASVNPNYVYSDFSYQWTQNQSGSGLFQNTASQSWGLIYYLSPNGGSFTVTPDGQDPITVSTAGAAGTFASVNGSWAAAGTHSISISKTAGGASDGVTIFAARIGAANGIAPLRLAIPGEGFVQMFQAGKESSMASLLAALNARFCVVASANNNNASLLPTFGQAFIDYLPTLTSSVGTDSSGAGLTSVCLLDLHLFVSGIVDQQADGTFGPAPQCIGPQWLYGLLSDLDQYGGLPQPLAFVSFSQYLGMRTQLDTLWNEGFYQDQFSNGFDNAHYSFTGAANIGITVADLMRGAPLAAKLVYTRQPTKESVNVPDGDAANPAVIVTIEDQFGTLDWIDDANIMLAINTGPGSMGGPFTVHSSGGVATFTTLAFDTPGTYTLVATDGSIQGISANISVVNPIIELGIGAAYTITGNLGSQTLDVSSGVITINIDLSGTMPNYDLKIENGAKVILANNQHLGRLDLLGNGTIDLATYSLTINYGSNASPNAAIQSYVASGYANGLWTGSGITSSWVLAQPATRAIGFADGADGIVNGLAPGQYLIRPTVNGDANLDGTVDFNDFVALATHFLATDINWDHGNFNYGPIIDFNDFVDISKDFLTSSGLMS
jgi:hypothetical protein